MLPGGSPQLEFQMTLPSAHRQKTQGEDQRLTSIGRIGFGKKSFLVIRIRVH